MNHPLSLSPLAPSEDEAPLTRLYRASPRYRATQEAVGNPHTQAQRDLAAAAAAPDRTLLGIMRVSDFSRPISDPSRPIIVDTELVGLIDFRRHWPMEAVAYIGLILVAESLQRQGIGSQAWARLEPWLAGAAAMRTARCGVEQSNPAGLRFMQHLGFSLTGKSDRIRRGERWVRLLYMEKELG